MLTTGNLTAIIKYHSLLWQREQRTKISVHISLKQTHFATKRNKLNEAKKTIDVDVSRGLKILTKIQIYTQTYLWTTFFATTTKHIWLVGESPFLILATEECLRLREKKYIVHRKKNSGCRSILFSFNGPKEEGVTCWLSTLGLSWHSSRKVNHFDINLKNSWKLIFVLVKKKEKKRSLFTWAPSRTNTVTVIKRTIEAGRPFSRRPQ